MATVIVSPHPDDADLGVSLLAQEADLIVVAGRDEDRRWEQQSSAGVLKMNTVSFGDWSDGEVTHDVRLVHFIEQGLDGATRVLVPPVRDSHQDHIAVGLACVSATRRSAITVLEYETPSVLPEWTPTMWLPMTEEDLDTQTRAIECHVSQQERSYMSRRWLEARAIFRGQQVGLPLAQAYRIVRHVGSL